MEHLVTFLQQDLRTVDLSKATVLMVFLNRQMMEQILPQVKTMKDGSRVISHAFKFNEYPTKKSIYCHGAIHKWILPLSTTQTDSDSEDEYI